MVKRSFAYVAASEEDAQRVWMAESREWRIHALATVKFVVRCVPTFTTEELHSLYGMSRPDSPAATAALMQWAKRLHLVTEEGDERPRVWRSLKYTASDYS